MALAGADELTHLIKMLVEQQTKGYRPFIYGHIASYDPKLHRVKCIIPTYTDDGNNYSTTPWMPLATTFTGASFGLQVAPLGGSSLQNPNQGEAVLIQIVERDRGSSVVAGMIFNNVDAAPGPELNGGEFILKAHSGSYLTGTKDGTWTLNTTGSAGKVIVNSLGDVDVTTQGNANVVASGEATISAPAIKLCKALTDTLYTLCTSAFYTWVVGHVHGDPQGGSTTVPTTSPPTNSLTSIVTAE